MRNMKNVSPKKSVITMILFITAVIASLYFTKVYSDVKSTQLILTNKYQTLSE